MDLGLYTDDGTVGKLHWQHAVKTAKDEMGFISVLADESLLLATARCFHIYAKLEIINGKSKCRARY